MMALTKVEVLVQRFALGGKKLKMEMEMEMGVVVMSNQRAGRMTSSEHAGATTLTTLRLSHSLKMFFGMYQMILNGSRSGKSSF
ncbi:MAG: hypothetical protein HN456_07680 [Rhodobacteraceae bacterium]|nr:hypothetical protein [Paracoccaceae bacterium]